MRTRTAIQNLVLDGNKQLNDFDAKNGVLIAACLEVLLDIRDLLSPDPITKEEKEI